MSCHPPARQVGPYRPEDGPHDRRTGAPASADLHVKPYAKRHVKVYADIPGPSRGDHFAFDAPKLTFYAAMCFTWLHQTEQAEEHARQVITHSTETPGVLRWPTRYAVAQVDLALLAAQRGHPDEAALRGTSALDSGRVVTSTLGWFAELDELLIRHHGAMPEVQDFHERYRAVRHSVTRRDPVGDEAEPRSRP